MFDITLMFMQQKRNETRNSFESCHMDNLSAWITVQTAARRELTRADAFTRSHEH